MNDSIEYLIDLSFEETLALCQQWGLKPFYNKILYQGIFKDGAQSLDDISNLPRAFRENLTQKYDIHRISEVQRLTSKDGTTKYLYRLPDNRFIETVRIPDRERITLCISTQVGCSVGCRFCASGLLGLDRNLTSGEIVDQVLMTLGKQKRKNTNIVVMGMGEPLMNFTALSKALLMLNDPRGIGLGARRITVSTVGLPEKIRALADLERQFNLAVSLHSADEEKRGELIPLAQKISLEELLESTDYYRHKTTRDVTYEVLLLKGVNDGVEDARKLAALLRGKKCTVNLIAFNRFNRCAFLPPGPDRIDAFRKVLKEARIPVTLRRSKGMDIDAACGQLRLNRIEGAED